jgi:hypothetical protein
VPAGHGGHPGIWFDPEQKSSPSLDPAGGDPGATAHVENGSRTAGQEVANQLIRIAGARTVVTFSIVPEALGPRAIHRHVDTLGGGVAVVPKCRTVPAMRRDRCMVRQEGVGRSD